jgi:hypothetical protein
MTRNNNRFIVLGCPNDLEEQTKDFGCFHSRQAAEVVVFAHIEEYNKYGMGIVQRGMFGVKKQWNYELRKGQVYSRENHGDLW